MDKVDRILQVSTADLEGGAERIAMDLARDQCARGLQAAVAVGRKLSEDPHVFALQHPSPNLWKRSWARLGREFRRSGKAWADRICHRIAEPVRQTMIARGCEDFAFPGTRRLLELPPFAPALVHLHNLHGSYFDLRYLPELTRRVPVVATLHDAWLLSGHCAHSLECERWRTGCGHCPDLSLYPEIPRDATAFNWHRKQRIFRQTRLYCATPSQWLMDKVECSILKPAIVDRRVIPNGVDLTVFKPGNQAEARQRLGLATDTKIILVVANGLRENPYKDYRCLRAALAALADRIPNLFCLALGEDSPPETIGSLELRFLPFLESRETLADYYRAADVYVHAARADTFPSTVLEALACGCPVAATAVGGIPEQIRRNETGLLSAADDSRELAAHIAGLLEQPDLRRAMATRAAEDARSRFSLGRMCDAYLGWYQEILAC